MKVTVIPIMIGALGKIPRVLLRGLEELKIRRRAEIVQTTAFLRPARILRRVLVTSEDLLSLVTWSKIMIIGYHNKY